MKFRETLAGSQMATYLQGATPIDCELGISPYGHSEHVDRAMRNLDLKMLTAYQEVFYDTNLMIQIIKRWGHHGISPENVFMGHGIFNIIERILHKLLKPSGMIGFGPQFNSIPSEMTIAGGLYTPILMENGKPPVDKMVDFIAREAAAYSVVFIDNPVNPTGYCHPLDDLRTIIHAARKQDLCVIVDEAYGDFIDDERSAIKLVPEMDNLFVTRSFSKAYGLASLRVGYVVTSTEIVPYYRKVDVPFEPSITSGIAATAALEDPNFLREVRERAQREKKVLSEGLIELGITVFPSDPGVSILLAHLPDQDLVGMFERAKVKVVSGDTFFNTHPGMDRSYVRIRVPGHTELCRDVLQRLKVQLEASRDRVNRDT